jgi:uncharacterized OsmC-like protein
MDESFPVVCSSGTLRPIATDEDTVTHFSHRWTDGGVEVVAGFTGAHLLHAAVAACVLNDLYREAEKLGIRLDGVRVQAEGGFGDDWASRGIRYRVELDSPADAAARKELKERVDRIAEIPRALRAGATVTPDD